MINFTLFDDFFFTKYPPFNLNFNFNGSLIKDNLENEVDLFDKINKIKRC